MPRSIAQVLRCLLAIGALSCIALPALAGTPVAPLRVMSFNVRVPADTDGDKRWQVRRAAMAASAPLVSAMTHCAARGQPSSMA